MILRILMYLLQSQAKEDCGSFVELVDLTDFAVQFRYDSPTPIGSLNRPEILAKVAALSKQVEELVLDTEVDE